MTDLKTLAQLKDAIFATCRSQLQTTAAGQRVMANLGDRGVDALRELFSQIAANVAQAHAGEREELAETIGDLRDELRDARDKVADRTSHRPAIVEELTDIASRLGVLANVLVL